jgi:hypothetical protein
VVPPSPRSIRFVGLAAKARPRVPPFGLSTWSDDGEAAAVQLDSSAADVSTAEAVASQIPPSDGFAQRTLVVVLGSAARQSGLWRRLTGAAEAHVSRKTRCDALLMRGYVDIEAGKDSSSQDLAWGWSGPL